MLSRREFEPYGVIHLDGRWYVAGRCLLREDLRTFRLDRISELALGAETFTRPADFEMREYMQRSMPFAQSAHTVDVWLDMPVEQARSHFALHRVAMRGEDGGTAMSCGRDSLEAFAAMLLSLGCRIVVRGPEELREAFRRLAARAAEAGR
jgi:predicted DNA-binding transcriptional regulator YafY